MNVKRLDYIDIAKGIGIISIVLGHLGIKAIDNVVFTFHVPLFFIISGLFIKENAENKTFILNKLKKLLVPYVYTCLALIILDCLICVYRNETNLIFKTIIDLLIRSIYASGANENNTLFGIKQIGAIWFLFALFWAQIIVKLTINKKYQFIYIIAIFAISFISSKYVWLPFSLQAGGTAALFVYVGYLLKKHKCTFDLNKINLGILVVGLILFYIGITNRIKISIVCNRFDAFPLSIISAIVISYCVIIISKQIEKLNILSKLLIFFGKNSLKIMCFHLIELQNAPWFEIIYLFLPSISYNTSFILMIFIKFLIIYNRVVDIVLI